MQRLKAKVLKQRAVQERSLMIDSKAFFSILNQADVITKSEKEGAMNFDSFEDILAYAIEKEKEAVAFYNNIAQKATFSGAKETLQGFAQEEQKHQAMLENFDKDKIVDYEFKWIPDLKRSDYLVDMEYEESMAYPDLLRLAMKREEKSLALYNDLQKNAETEEIRDLFKFLAQEEAIHKNKLETIYDDAMAGRGD